MTDKINKLHFVFGFVLFVIFVSFTSVSAQKSKIVEGGIVNGVPYASTDFENINLTNGNLNLSFPLASLQGRGSSGFTYSLHYNSKLWQAMSNPVYGQNGQITYQDFLGGTEEGGWEDLGWYQLSVRNRNAGMDAPTGNICQGPLAIAWRLAYRWKVELKAPDGSKIEFRPTGYSDIPPGGTAADGGYFNVHPDGRVSTLTGNCTPVDTPPTNTPTTYYSSDGSGMRLTFSNNETAAGYVWELSMPDGSKVVQTSNGQRIIDRNSNYVETATITLPDGSQAPGWIDQVGRYIARKKNSSANEDTYYQQGFNGELLTWKVKWKTVYVYRNYTTSCNTCGNQRGPVINTTAQMDFHVVERIELPTQLGGLVYLFDYYAKDVDDNAVSPGWGEVKSVTTPTTAKVTYGYILTHFDPLVEYTEILPEEINLTTNQILERVGTIRDKKLNYTEQYDGATQAREYSWGYATSRTGSSVTAPDGGVSAQSFWDIVNDIQKGGQVYKVTNPNGTIVERIWRNNFPAGFNYGSGGRLNPYVKTEFTTIPDASGNPSLTAIKDFNYDKNGNLLSVAEYDWVPYNTLPRNAEGFITGIPSGEEPVRTTVTSYYNPTPNATDTTTNSTNAYWNVSAPTLRNLVQTTGISGSSVTRTEILYDNIQDITGTPTNGNPTKIITYDSHKNGTYHLPTSPLTSTNSITTSTAYDQYGNPTLITGANNNQTQITYGAVNGYTGLYPTQTISAYGTSIAQTATAEYDFYTGLVKRATVLGNNANENVTTETEYDPLGRQKKVKTAVSTPNEVWTATEYDNVNRRVIVRADLEVKGDGKRVSIQHYDQLGRVRLSRKLEDSATQSATNESDGIKVQMRYLFNGNYSYQVSSNPYRAATSALAATEETMGWTRSKTINTGKHSETETFTGASLPAPWGSNTNSTGVVITDVDANATTVTDQAGKQGRSIVNGLGQLIRVDEPDNSGNLGTVDNPVQPTIYKYNTLGKMIEVVQGIQSRYFLYDSLGRLLRVRQPEQNVNSALYMSNNDTTNTQWTVGFSYDNNGNILTATDAKNVTINSTYDGLNRMTSKSYSDSVTPTVNFIYDEANVPNSKGKLTKVSSSISETRYTAFDSMGRLLSSEQATDGQIYPSSYKYNLAGILLEQTYPSGRVVKEFLTNDGNLSAISSRAWNGQFKTYASNFSYTASGVVKSLQIGNGLWESAKLNSRQQVTELNLGTSPTDGSKWQMKYDYGELDTNGNIDSTKNSGNIARQTISFAGLAQPFVQTYKYDSLDRITEAKETSGGNQTWIQDFDYDRYGNRTSFSQNILGQQLQLDNLTLPQVDANTNRFQTGQGYNYDANGNLIQVTSGMQFTFDGENKQTEVRDGANNIIGRYYYDGNGKRVKKVTNSEMVIFVYDGMGKLAAEYSTTPPQNPTTNYTATDPLGSPRVITNKFGEIVSRRDFMPFGEQLAPDATYRTANLKYSNDDTIRQKFTGYQRDEETDLDFAEARYYNDQHGRFTAVDPLLASGKSTNPQTFNRYVYTMNRPLILTDSTGLQAGKQAPQKNEKPTQEKQKPPSTDEVQLTGTSRDLSRDGYQLRISGYTPFAINNGVVTDGEGNVIENSGLNLTKTTNGFGIIVTYELSTGDFPSPDKGASTTIEEKITDSTLDGKPAPPQAGDVADKPVEGKIVDGKITFTDFVGTKNSNGNPNQVSESNQSITITTTIGGNKERFEIRTNRIVVNPNSKVKIKITDTTPKPDEEL